MANPSMDSTRNLHSPPPARNPWPLAIVTVFAVFVAGTGALIALACGHRTDLVSRDYYEQEIRFQGQMDRLRRTRRLQPPASVTYEPARGQIRVSLPPEHASRGAQGRIQLYRPSAASLDCRIDLALDPDGQQAVDVQNLRRGAWKVRVSWTVQGEEYFLDQSLLIGS
jgi:hypothetical protein